MLQGLFFEKRGADAYHEQFLGVDQAAARSHLVNALCLEIHRAHNLGRKFEALQLCLQTMIVEGGHEELLRQMYRIFSSVAASVHSLMLENATITAAMHTAVQQQEWDKLNLCKEQFIEYKDRLLELVFTNESSELIEIRHHVNHVLGDLIDEGKLRVDDETQSKMDEIYDLCDAALVSMLDDILKWFPSIEEVLQRLVARSGQEILPAYIPKRTMRCVDMRLEEKRLLSERKIPDAIFKEAAILQYVVHCKIDSWLEDTIVDIFSTIIPPNPFPSIIHHMRRLSFRFLLKDNRDDSVLQNSCTTDVPRIPGGHIYHKDNVAYGTFFSVAFVDPLCVSDLKESLQALRNLSGNVRQSAFEMRVTTGISNAMLAFSALVPISPSSLNLIEDYFVTSLDREKAFDVFTESILTHVLAIHDQPGHLVTGLKSRRREETSQLWTVEQLKTERVKIKVELKQIVRDQHRVWVEIQMLHNQDYIHVVKDFVMHFQDARSKGRFEQFAPATPFVLYSVFFLDESEAHHFVENVVFEDPYHWGQLADFRDDLKSRICHAEVNGKWLECSSMILTLVSIYKYHGGSDTTALEADAARVVGSLACNLRALRCKCEILYGMLCPLSTEVQRKIESNVLRRMLEHFCDDVLEQIHEDDCCCLEGVRYLIHVCTHHLQKDARNFDKEMGKSLLRIRNYLLGVEKCTATVLHGACHGHRGPASVWMQELEHAAHD